MADDLRPRDWTGNHIDKPLTDDLADVLARTVVGWEQVLGADLAEAPEVKRVLARYRAEKSSPIPPPAMVWNENLQRYLPRPQIRPPRPLTDDYPVCPKCGAVAYGNAGCSTCRAHWPGGDPVSPPTERCEVPNGDERCIRVVGHDGFHDSGLLTWASLPAEGDDLRCGQCGQWMANHGPMGSCPSPPAEGVSGENVRYPENATYGCVDCGSTNHTTGDVAWCLVAQAKAAAEGEDE